MSNNVNHPVFKDKRLFKDECRIWFAIELLLKFTKANFSNSRPMMKVSQVGNTSIDISIPFKPTHNPTQGIKVCPWHPSTTSRLCSADFLWSRFFVTSWIFIIYPTALRNDWVSVTNYLWSPMIFKTMRPAAVNLCELWPTSNNTYEKG